MRSVMLTLLALVACGGEETDSDTDALGTGTGGGEPAVQPAEGGWTTSGRDLVSDDCGLWSPSTEEDWFPTAFDISLEDDGSFSVSGSGFSTGCTSQGSRFTCDPIVDSGPFGYGLDADIATTIDVSGTLAGEADMDATSEVTLDCDGPDCPQVTQVSDIDFPCRMKLTATASAD